jgi:outer membrane lipase/esterase
MITLAVGVLPRTAQAVPYNGLVVFGDSLADSGNIALLLDSASVPGSLRTAVPLSGPDANNTFTATFPYASNRYTNGPNWVDQFAAALGLSSAPSLAGGGNYAYGGAKVAANANSLPPSLQQQAQLFFTATSNVAAPGNLYVVQGGGNDARQAFAAALDNNGNVVSSLIASYATATFSILAALESGGAEHILLANVPDIGKIPAVQAFGPAIAQRATEIASAFNTALANTLGALPETQRDDILLLDLFGLTGDVFNDPASRGFTDVTSVCVLTQACVDNPDGVFFWDGIHPTTAGHGAIADAALLLVQDVAAEVPLPGTLWLFIPGLSLLLLAGRRRPAQAGLTGMRASPAC